MNSSIFTTYNYSINAALVSAIGPVQEIPVDIRKGEAISPSNSINLSLNYN